MRDGPDPCEPAALIGDPARAAILTTLLDGRAWTASELAFEAGVGAPTASAHLSKLVAGGLVTAVAQGRHRYFRLASGDVAAVLEALMKIAAHTSPPKRRPGPRDAGMRQARSCYDHIAGGLGVAIFDGMRQRRWIKVAADCCDLTPMGRTALEETFGIDTSRMPTSRRAMVKPCLDWSERTEHLGGALGAALLERARHAGWISSGGGRMLKLTPLGEKMLRRAFGERFLSAA